MLLDISHILTSITDLVAAFPLGKSFRLNEALAKATLHMHTTKVLLK